jgi:predicted small secreted protein
MKPLVLLLSLLLTFCETVSAFRDVMESVKLERAAYEAQKNNRN